MGQLQIKGIIDISQFWPIDSSDADTTKMSLLVDENSFSFKADDSDVFIPVTVYFDAVSRGSISTPVIKKNKQDDSQKITIRLQGVDAPELHYRASPLKRSEDVSDEKRALYNKTNKERRQHLAESATVALTRRLKRFANENGLIEAVFITEIEKPADAVDTYGRFIGDLVIDTDFNLNLWLIKYGWAIPAFYTSMSNEEITEILKLWKTGKNKKNRTGKLATNNADEFNWELLYREPPIEEKFVLGEDKGVVIMPKIYRRQTAWLVSKEAGIIKQNINFKQYLSDKPDQLLLVKDFLENTIHSATVYNLDDFISTENKVLKAAEELVFKEKPGTLVNNKGKKVTEWF